jgi:F-type H+-transporting ATPase subunit delta
MAELATIARPYAEALYRAAAGENAGAWVNQVNALAAVAANAGLRQFAGNPKAIDTQVYDVVTGVAGLQLDAKVGNLLRAVIDNGRLAALPEIAVQFQHLVNASSGVSDAVIHSAYAIDEAQLATVVAALERRYGRKLNATVQVDPELIGGIRVVVGDEVLDTSVRARLEQMKVALTA